MASQEDSTRGQRLRREYELFLEGSNLKTMRQSLNQFYFIRRRLISALVLVLLSEYPYFQISIMLLMSFYNLIYLITDKPLADQRENKIEIFNETCILLFGYMVATCLNEAIPQSLNDTIGFLLIGFTSTNIIINLALVGQQTIVEIFLAGRNWFRSRKQMKEDQDFDQ